eukprot:1157779_1
MSINDKNIREHEKLTVYDLDILYLERPMILDTEIQCVEVVSNSLIIKTHTESFGPIAQSAFRDYFNNQYLLFTVVNDDDELRAIPKFLHSEPPDLTVVYLAVFIVSCGILCSLAAFAMNKTSSKVDNSSFLVPFLISLGIYDFVSDINFTIQVWQKASFALSDVVTWLGASSTFFTLLPLASNLIYAMRISKQKTINANPAARAWFKSHLNVFILITFASAGAYPALSLVTSRIFGLDFFNCGLLTSELHELSKIKIKSTVLTENCPQLLIQVAYSIIINKIESDTMLAFVASTLSVFASLIVYQAQKDQLSEGHICKYFVRFYSDRVISQQQQEQIKQNKGLKEKLSLALSFVFEVPQQTIEVGYVTIVGTGCVINIQHFVFNDDMQVLREKLLKQMGHSGYYEFDLQITPHQFVKHCYETYQRQIADVLSLHFFDEKNDLFYVEYHSKFEEASKMAQDDGNHSQIDDFPYASSDDEGHDHKKDGILEVMATKLRQKTINRLQTIKHGYDKQGYDQVATGIELQEMNTNLTQSQTTQKETEYMRRDKQGYDCVTTGIEMKEMDTNWTHSQTTPNDVQAREREMLKSIQSMMQSTVDNMMSEIQDMLLDKSVDNEENNQNMENDALVENDDNQKALSRVQSTNL